MKSAEYWKKRSEQIAKLQFDKVDAYEAAQRKEYARATMEIKRDIETFYARYATENGVDMVEARKILTKGEHRDFKMTLEEFIEKAKDNADGRWTQQLNNAYYKTRISRLEALQLQINQRVELLAGKRQAGTGELLGDIYKDTYYRNLYELHKGMGFGTSFAKIDDAGLQSILGAKLDGRNWSQRIWDDRTKLKQQIQTKLAQAFIRGDTADRAIRDVVERLNVSKSNAERLIQTESAYFVGQATKAGYLASGVVKQYELLATLDSRTSPICRELDGKVFPISEADVGVNYPPLHVRCRTTTVASFGDDDEDPGERFARDPQGKYNLVPGNITYAEWKKQYIDRSDGDAKDGKVAKFAELIAKIPNVPQDYKKVLEERFAAGSPTAQRVYLDYVTDNVINDGRFRGASHYDSRDRVINMDFEGDLNDPRGAASTFFHEFGHYVDNLAAIRKVKRTTTYGVSHLYVDFDGIAKDEFKKAILQDAQEYTQNYVKSKNIGSLWTAQHEISKELQANGGHLHSAISDIYSGATGGLVKGKYAHDKKYWKDVPGAIEQETFAHMFEASFDPTGKKSELMKQYLPKSFELFNRILEVI